MNNSQEEATQIILSKKSTQHCSLMENEFVKLLEEAVGFKLEHTSQCSPYGKWANLLNTYVVYDVCHRNCIIEFNGDYWHANPDIYKDSAMVHGRRAVDIWQRDKLKLQTATDLGFVVLTVWENEFKHNKKQLIEKATKWMLSELK